jgi:hypothetical protein
VVARSVTRSPFFDPPFPFLGLIRCPAFPDAHGWIWIVHQVCM